MGPTLEKVTMAIPPSDRMSTSAEADERELEREAADAGLVACPSGGVSRKDLAPISDLDALEEETRRRLEVESTLQDSEARYRLLYDNNPTMYFTLSPDGTVVSVNQFGATQLGYQPVELIGQSVLKVFKPEDHAAVLGQLTVCAASPLKVFQWEIQKVRKDGSKLWVKERAQTVIDHRGQILSLVVCEDITERRLTEEYMRESEERWRALFEHAGVGIAQLSLNGQFLRVNPRLCETLGFSSKTMLRRRCQDFVHPEALTVMEANLTELLAGRRPSCSMETRWQRSDDVWLWVHMTLSLVRDATSAPAYFIAVVQNIDDRKQAEAGLARTTRLLQTLVRESPLPIVSLDLDARVTSWNQAATRLFGWTEDEVLGRELPYVPEEESASANLLWERGLRGEVEGPIELRRRGKDGRMLDLLLWPVFVRSDIGDVSTAIGLYVDQSDLKRAEEELSASEERFSKAFRSSPYPIGITELDTGVCLDINDAALSAFGYTREEVIGQTTFGLGIWPNAGARQQFIERLKSKGSVRNLELPLKSKRGDVRRFLASTEVIVLKGKECLVTIGTDITEQKRAEEALRRSELAVRQAFEERERLSQDLHDNLLQSLYAVGMGLELTKQRIQRVSRTNAKRLEHSVAQLNNVIREVRSFISHVQPAVLLDEPTVADALRALAGSFMATGAGEILVTVEDELSLRLSPEQRTHMLAIAKEALSNSIRHTEADKRIVTLRRHGNKIRLEVIDNGHGFSPAQRRAQGMGLQNMRARARKLRGRIAITSILRQGTTVTLTIPST
jgi:PAS domain S-box-containing protein